MKERISVLDVEYFIEDNRPVVRIWGKDQRGNAAKFLDRNFLPYFYIEAKEGRIEAVKKRLEGVRVEGFRAERIETVRRKFLGAEKELVKAYIRVPADVGKFRDAVKDWPEVKEEYEYTIPFYKRYMIDKGIVPTAWMEVEIVSPLIRTSEEGIGGGEIRELRPAGMGEYPELRAMAFSLELVEGRAGDEISRIELSGPGGFRKSISKKPGFGEKGILESFVDIVREKDPDILLGYNSDRLDFPKLEGKARKHKIELGIGREGRGIVFERRGRTSAAYIPGRIHLDLYNFVARILGGMVQTEGMGLDMVAKELIGTGGKNGTSADLVLRLGSYLVPQIFEISRVAGQTPFDSGRMYYSQLVEWLYIRRAKEKGEISPNTPKYDEIQRRTRVSYIGGYVHPPKEGLHENVSVFDFASLYPSITITHNVSPETLDCKCCRNGRNRVAELNHHYCTRKRGFVSGVIEELLERRIEVKESMRVLEKGSEEYRILDNRQRALKILANASYGYYAYPGSRWYSKVCAESITALGRMYIKNMISLAGKMGYEVIYGDTDSLFLKMKRGEEKRFLERVNSILPGIMELEFKGFYKSGIFVQGKAGQAAKKRYALADEKGNILIRGFETVRRDWSGIAKEVQERVLEFVLNEKKVGKAVSFVKKVVQDLEAGKMKKDKLVIYTQLTRPVEEYEQIGPHVAVAKKIIGRGGQVRVGATIRYIVTRGSGSISERSETFELAKKYDPGYYIHHQVIPAAMRILGGMGIKEEDFFSGKDQISLEKYLKRNGKKR